MIVLGFDTATPATAIGLRLTDGSAAQARDDPQPGERPGHATRLLPLAAKLLAGAGLRFRDLDRIAVGLGPGTFTGLRIGVATARGLAQSLGIELVGVSSLRALAEPVLRELDGSHVLAVLDARRGEAFVAGYEMTDRRLAEELVSPRALAPEDLESIVAQAEAGREDEHDGRWRAVGDGAVRFRSQLETAGVAVPPDSSLLHLLSAEMICDLGARAEPVASYEAIVPDYRRRPDAEIALESARALRGALASEGAHAREGR
jgi:tRNA threonylcarbamoyladenosine biosynthesis protein TsaB